MGHLTDDTFSVFNRVRSNNMKYKDAFQYAFIKMARNKKNVYFIIIMTLCVFVLIASVYFYIVFFDIENKSYTRSLEARRIIVEDVENGNEKFSRILEINHVIDMYEYEYHTRDIDEFYIDGKKQKGYLTFNYGSEITQPKNINGRRISKDDTGVAICSKNFKTTSNSTVWSSDKIKFKNMDDLIGKTIYIEDNIFTKEDDREIMFGTYTKEYEIVGTFDAQETMDRLGTCYISPKDMQELSESTKVGYSKKRSFRNVIVDDIKNVDEVNNKIKKIKSLTTSLGISKDYTYLNQINKICFAIISVIIIVVVFLSELYIKKQYTLNKNELALMKAYGYDKKNIIRVSLASLLYLMFHTFIIGITFFTIVLINFKSAFKNYMIYTNSYFGFYLSPYIIAILILMVISVIVNSITVRKIIRKQPMSILKG